MHPLAKYAIIFLYTSVLWIVVLYLYNRFIEGFDFGNFPGFLGKSVLLIAVVSLCGFHLYGILLSVIIWWGGLMLLFKKEFWECRILVLLLWGLFFVTGMLITGVLIENWDVYPPNV
jgi:hypothetical protein